MLEAQIIHILFTIYYSFLSLCHWL